MAAEGEPPGALVVADNAMDVADDVGARQRQAKRNRQIAAERARSAKVLKCAKAKHQ